MSEPASNTHHLAAVIRAYWNARGLSPAIWVERQAVQASATDARAVYVIRSDMVGGWPSATRSPAKPTPKINPGLMGDSSRPYVALAAIRQRASQIESVRPSNRVWREVAGKVA